MFFLSFSCYTSIPSMGLFEVSTKPGEDHFGSGKVNALRAVERAKALLGPTLVQTAAAVPVSQVFEESVRPTLMAVPQPAWNVTLTAQHLRDRPGRVLGVVLHDTAGSGTHND